MSKWVASKTTINIKKDVVFASEDISECIFPQYI